MKRQTKKIQKQKTDEKKSKLHVYEILASGVPKQVFFVWKMNGPTAHEFHFYNIVFEKPPWGKSIKYVVVVVVVVEVDKTKPIQLTVYTLTSVCRFSILFPINFLKY